MEKFQMSLAELQRYPVISEEAGRLCYIILASVSSQINKINLIIDPV